MPYSTPWCSCLWTLAPIRRAIAPALLLWTWKASRWLQNNLWLIDLAASGGALIWSRSGGFCSPRQQYWLHLILTDWNSRRCPHGSVTLQLLWESRTSRAEASPAPIPSTSSFRAATCWVFPSLLYWNVHRLLLLISCYLTRYHRHPLLIALTLIHFGCWPLRLLPQAISQSSSDDFCDRISSLGAWVCCPLTRSWLVHEWPILHRHRERCRGLRQ